MTVDATYIDTPGVESVSTGVESSAVVIVGLQANATLVLLVPVLVSAGIVSWLQ